MLSTQKHGPCTQLKWTKWGREYSMGFAAEQNFWYLPDQPSPYTLLHAVVNKTHDANHPKQILYILMFVQQICFGSHSARGARNLHSLCIKTVDSTWKRDATPPPSNLKPETNHWWEAKPELKQTDSINFFPAQTRGAQINKNKTVENMPNSFFILHFQTRTGLSEDLLMLETCQAKSFSMVIHSWRN